MKLLCYSYMELPGRGQAGGPGQGGLLHNLLTDPRHVEELLQLLTKKTEQVGQQQHGCRCCWC